MYKITLNIILTGLICHNLYGQGFLRAEGTQIVNGSGENVILKGIGTGNWMLLEGYMMKTEDLAGTHHAFRNKLIETIGEERTNIFFETWLANHFTKSDVDSMKAWGFNSVRVALHYKWFTLPIEEEPIPGQNTWLEKGFEMVDQLLEWCKANQMYLILDLHGAPGGQGANADISDYDSSKPSLWESEDNKNKTVALWRKFAERYHDEEWIGGYDIINETNWTFPEKNNWQMRKLFGRITDAIRETDKNHIIFIEGNSYANDHDRLVPPWDNNLVYSFHKYSSGTSENDLDWILALRDAYNVPLWMGEAGENSNTWYTDLITLCEKNNIGWSWWPVKKNSINNVLNVTLNADYEDLVKYWKGESSKKPTEEEAFQAVMQWAENHKIENCKIQYDVIDAMIRQPNTDNTIPYKNHDLTEPVFFSDFDLGKNGYAYYDKDFAYYGGDWIAWNKGWGVRNDGVDIQECMDSYKTNGFNVGWTENGEWYQYSFISDSSALYSLDIRHAAQWGGSQLYIEINDSKIEGSLSLAPTGAWQNWETTTFHNIHIPAGKVRIKFVNERGGSNLNYFEFFDPKPADEIEFEALSAKSSVDGKKIYVGLSKEITNENLYDFLSDFSFYVDGNKIQIKSIEKDTTASTVLILSHDNKIYSNNLLKVSYSGSGIMSGIQYLKTFSDLTAENNVIKTHIIPGSIQAEDYIENNGFALEQCLDIYGGQNTGFANPGDYLDYQVYVTRTGIYEIKYRVATERLYSELIFQVSSGDSFTSLDTIKFSRTGGWQAWQTQSTQVRLEKGYCVLRLLVKSGEHNLNWFELDMVTLTVTPDNRNNILVFPNPAKNAINIQLLNQENKNCYAQITNLNGQIIKELQIINVLDTKLDVGNIAAGHYLLKITNSSHSSVHKIIIQR